MDGAGQRRNLVTELGLILGIDLAGLLFALALSRWLTARDAGGAPARRLGSALERAARSFLWREFRVVALVAIAVAIVAAVAFGLLRSAGLRLSPAECAFWTAAGVALGAVLACVSARAAVGLSLRASVRCAAAAHSSTDRALGLAIRAGGAAGLVAETASALAATALFGLIYAIEGGFALPLDQAVPLALEVACVLPGFAVGAALSGLLIQRGGGAYHASSDVGGDQAGELEAGLMHDDPRNPTSVAELVGDQVGQTAPRAADLFASATAANVTAIVIGAFAAASLPSPPSRPLALLALPLLVRAFGVIASAFAIMVVRTTEASDPSAALLRGHIAATAIAVAGIGGASFWLVREHWLAFFGAGALGLVAAVAVAYFARFRVERRSAPVREAIDGLRAGAGATVALGLGSGMRSVVVPTLALGVSAWPAWSLGAASGLPSGAPLSIVVWLTAILACGSYVLAVGALGPIADNAAGVAALQSKDLDAKRRTARLDDVGFSATAGAQAYLIVASSSSAVVSALALPILARSDLARALTVASSNPILVWCGALGAALVLAYSGSVARAGARGAKEIALEVERQLRGFPREHGLAQVPAEFTPSYKDCVELSARGALRRATLDVLPVVLAPLGLGLALRWATREHAGLAVEALTSFVVMTAVTGFSAALALDGARAALGKVRRESRAREGAPGFSQSVSADAFADIFGNAAGPAARLVTLCLATTALAVAPFLN